MAFDFDLDRFVPLDMFEINGEFHVCTRRKTWKRGGRRGSDQRTTSRRSITAGKLRGNDAGCSKQFLQLANMAFDFDLDWFVPLDMFEIDREFHVCTRRKA